MILPILLMAAPVADVVVVSGAEPRAADPWVEVMSASCGSERLEIRRPIRPLAARAEVLVDGQPARGEVEPVARDLSEPGAAYRLSLQCSRDGAKMYLRWVSGLAQGNGQVRYRSGAATFQNGALVESRTGEANAEAFWYR